MKIGASTYDLLPPNLKALFRPLENEGRAEVLAGFPDVHGAGSACDAKWDGNKRSVYGKYEGGLHGSRLGDSGSAARFFYTVKPDLPPAPSQPERNAPVSDSAGDGSPKDGTSELLSETCGKRFHYTAKADADDRLGSKHPTVKPVNLMQWLVRLVTPPGGLCLDPFSGTGTTGEAAFREGMMAILIEREAEYVKDIERRMALCLAGPVEREHQSTKARQGDSKPDHGPLFGGVE